MRLPRNCTFDTSWPTVKGKSAGRLSTASAFLCSLTRGSKPHRVARCEAEQHNSEAARLSRHHNLSRLPSRQDNETRSTITQCSSLQRRRRQPATGQQAWQAQATKRHVPRLLAKMMERIDVLPEPAFPINNTFFLFMLCTGAWPDFLEEAVRNTGFSRLSRTSFASTTEQRK